MDREVRPRMAITPLSSRPVFHRPRSSRTVRPALPHRSDSAPRRIAGNFAALSVADFVYRGTERMGLVALSLCIRTIVYASGVWFWVSDATRIIWVPTWLALGESCGIALVWGCYARRFGVPRPVLGGRFLRVFLRRG